MTPFKNYIVLSVSVELVSLVDYQEITFATRMQCFSVSNFSSIDGFESISLLSMTIPIYLSLNGMKTTVATYPFQNVPENALEQNFLSEARFCLRNPSALVYK